MPPKKHPRKSLTHLGSGPIKPTRKLEAFQNSYPKRNTVITFQCDEFTCLCPITGQPDFAALEISYIPNNLVLESKSLKLYLWTYRDVGIFHENVCNELLDALSAFLKPRWIRVSGQFNIRGGIGIDVAVQTGKAPN
jgi:7-cyano-7-deazaguanine reductase